ncbi:MAG: Holliday junction resolvase RuvX [Mucinivorans sp.]
MGRILAIDYGKKRVGIAVTDPLRIIASPVATVASGETLDWLEKYFTAFDVDTVVIGMPLQMDGTPSESQRYIRPFMSRFRARFPPICLCEADERFTSVIAHRAMIDGGVPKMKRRDKEMVDRTAASIILQGYLETIQ